jgi:hypothetical protein
MSNRPVVPASLYLDRPVAELQVIYDLALRFPGEFGLAYYCRDHGLTAACLLLAGMRTQLAVDVPHQPLLSHEEKAQINFFKMPRLSFRGNYLDALYTLIVVNPGDTFEEAKRDVLYALQHRDHEGIVVVQDLNYPGREHIGAACTELADLTSSFYYSIPCGFGLGIFH